MSTTPLRTFACSRCSAPIKARIAVSINAERSPQLRDAILKRYLHTYNCAACDAAVVVETEFLYIDMGRGQFYGVYPPGALSRSRECAEVVAAAFERTLGKGAPKKMANWGRDFQCRVCFGLEELREKIAIARDGLDDLTVEALKADVMVARPGMQHEAVRTLRFETVDPNDGSLRFFAEHEGDPPRMSIDRIIAVERELYDKVDEPWRDIIAKRPYIASGPHVSLLRALTWEKPAEDDDAPADTESPSE
jgi:hypothetical protein